VGGPIDDVLLKIVGKFRVDMKANLISSIGEFVSDAIFNGRYKRQV
jgi:hypothetical protein